MKSLEACKSGALAHATVTGLDTAVIKLAGKDNFGYVTARNATGKIVFLAKKEGDKTVLYDNAGREVRHIGEDKPSKGAKKGKKPEKVYDLPDAPGREVFPDSANGGSDTVIDNEELSEYRTAGFRGFMDTD